MAQLRYPDKNTYFLINQSRVGVNRLADQEALDLDLDPFMSFCDHTSSAPGCQFLYDSLRSPDSDGGIPARHEHLIDTLSENNSRRKNLQTTLQKLDSHDAFSIATLFDSDFPVVSGLKRTLLYIASLIPFTTALLLLLSQSGIWLLILCASLILNLGLHYWNKIKMQSYFVAIPQLAVLFKCADLLSRDAMFKDVNPDIRSLLATCAPLRKKLRYFNFSVRVENEMSGFFFFFSELINYFTLNEVRQVNSAFEELKSKNKDIEQIYRFVATLDMLDSVATMRAKSPFWCHPRFEDQLSLRSVYHPLIDGCVANDLRLDHRSMLLTGSNMAGKSTFIRTVGINLLASKTLNTCFAQGALFPRSLQLKTSMRLTDNLLEGTSFYRAEVNRILQLLTDSSSEKHHLFLLDEIFKGTNTIERIAAAKATLSALASEGNYVIAATHDIELANLLHRHFDLYHFCEQVIDDNLYFDYKLHEGMLRKRNAIRILEISGFPRSVIAEAELIASQLEQKTNK